MTLTSAVTDVATSKKTRAPKAQATAPAAPAAPTAAPGAKATPVAAPAAPKPAGKGIKLKGGKTATEARAALREALAAAKAGVKVPAANLAGLGRTAGDLTKQLAQARKELGAAYASPQNDAAMQKQRLKDAHANVASVESLLKAANKDVEKAAAVVAKAKAAVEAVKAKQAELEQTIAAAKAG